MTTTGARRLGVLALGLAAPWVAMSENAVLRVGDHQPPRFQGDYAIAVLGDLYCEQGRERGASSNGRWARRWLLVARGEDARERLVSGQTHRP